MGAVTVRRQERLEPPEMPQGQIVLESPPEIPEAAADSLRQVLMYMPMLGMGAAMALMMIGSVSSTSSGSSVTYIGGGIMGVCMAGMFAGQIGRGKGERKTKLNGARRDYLRYLGQVRRRVRRAAIQQSEALEWNGPDPATLWSVLLADHDLARVWERRPSDPDFAEVRIGRGTQQLAVSLVPPDTKPLEDLDLLTAASLRRFMQAHSTVPGLPVSIALRSFARIIAAGDTEAVHAVTRAVIAQLAAFHSPADLRICVCAPKDRLGRWQWIKWLPHNTHPTAADAAGPLRLIAPDLPQLEEMLGADFRERGSFVPGKADGAHPYHVIIADGAGAHGSQLTVDGVDGVVVIDLGQEQEQVPRAADRATLRLRVSNDQVERISRDRTGAEVAAVIGTPDLLSLPEAEALARQLAPLRPATDASRAEDQLVADRSLTSLLGIADPAAIDVGALWRPRPPRHQLRVPIGTSADGGPVELDIKESASGGMGPHGILIGATGSGKSELLRTLVLALAVTHPPEMLNFVLVDFKGGTAFLGLEGLNHVSAVITNLSDELPLVDRMHDALDGELVRRQELLRAAGNYKSLHEYEQARKQGASLAQVPTLFVVIDEFSQLLSARPEFIGLFDMIGRLGRGLGVHLLLASQRLEEGRMHALEAHISYKIALRTFTASQSRVVLGTSAAYDNLPDQPGNGYLKDADETIRFKAAYVSGPAVTPSRQEQHPQHQQIQPMVVPFASQYIPPRVLDAPPAARPESEPGEPAKQETTLEIVARQLAGKGEPARRIWLPPLDKPSTLDQLMPPLSATASDGYTADGWQQRGRLHAVAGIVDRPFEQRRDPLWLDLSGSAGHLGVAGAPQSGKSIALRTVICSLALLHTPQQVQFYCLDFGGGMLRSLARLPHVGGVATRTQPDRVRRTVAEVQALLEQREREFSERGIDSISNYRRMRASGEITGDGYGDVFLVVDGWLTIRQEYEQLEQAITALAARGLGYGIHVMTASLKWSDFRPGIRDLFGTRLELRLGDPFESDMNRKLAAAVPQNSPGRGLTPEGLHLLTALPRIDGQPDAATLSEGTTKLAETVDSAWHGLRAPAVRLLPDVLPATELPGPGQTGGRIPIGVDESTLSPVFLDFAEDSHFLLFGDTECGKSNLLRLFADAITQRYRPEEARIIFVDYRRSLLDSAESPLRLGYAAASTAAAQDITEARRSLLKRLPPPDLTPAQLRSRSWWSGPALFVIADDYDLISGADNPLLPLADLLPQGRDIGLHLIVARSAGGAGRAMFDPVIQRLRDMSATALIMSGSREEGALIGGVRPQKLPPGRGFLVRRHGGQLIQTALADADPADGRPEHTGTGTPATEPGGPSDDRTRPIPVVQPRPSAQDKNPSPAPPRHEGTDPTGAQQ